MCPVHRGIQRGFGSRPSRRKLLGHRIYDCIDLYGRRVGIEFISRLRGMIKFDDAAALIAQMKQDVARAREILLAGRP